VPNDSTNPGVPVKHGVLAKPEPKIVPWPKLVKTFASLTVWVLLFSSGLLIETVEHRYQLAPRSVEKQVGPEGMKSVHGYVPPDQPVAVAKAAETAKSGEDPKPFVSPPTNPSTFASIKSFFVTMVCYTPINLALLTLVAGLIGGYASNITLDTMSDEQLADMKKRFPRRDFFLQEPPISAAIRGFVVFLCVVAGLYLAMDDPFKDPTSGQYIRLAGSISVMAFLVGYDASRLEDWLRIVPGPKSDADNGNGTQAEQNPPAATGASTTATIATATAITLENKAAPAAPQVEPAALEDTVEQADAAAQAKEAEVDAAATTVAAKAAEGKTTKAKTAAVKVEGKEAAR